MKYFTDEELEALLSCLKHEPMPEFWTIEEPDPGGMLGGGGGMYLDKSGHYTDYTGYNAMQFKTYEECRDSPHNRFGYPIKKVSLKKYPPKLDDEQIKALVIDLIASRQYIRTIHNG